MVEEPSFSRRNLSHRFHPHESNITLELEAGATLKFSENFDDFLPYVEVRHEGIMMKSFQPLIYAVDAENITIKGEGTLDGQGKAWWTEFSASL